MSSTPKRGEAQLFRSHVTAPLSISSHFTHLPAAFGPFPPHFPRTPANRKTDVCVLVTCAADASPLARSDLRTALLRCRLLGEMLHMQFEDLSSPLSSPFILPCARQWHRQVQEKTYAEATATRDSSAQQPGRPVVLHTRETATSRGDWPAQEREFWYPTPKATGHHPQHLTYPSLDLHACIGPPSVVQPYMNHISF